MVDGGQEGRTLRAEARAPQAGVRGKEPACLHPDPTPGHRMAALRRRPSAQSKVSSRGRWSTSRSTTGMSTQHLPSGNPGLTGHRKCHRWGGGRLRAHALPGKAEVSSLQSSPGVVVAAAALALGAPAGGSPQGPVLLRQVGGRRSPTPRALLAAHLPGGQAQGRLLPPARGRPSALLGHSAAKRRPPGHGSPGGLSWGPGMVPACLGAGSGPYPGLEQSSGRRAGLRRRVQDSAWEQLPPSPRSSPDGHTQRPRAPCPPTMASPASAPGPLPSPTPSLLHGARGS